MGANKHMCSDKGAQTKEPYSTSGLHMAMTKDGQFVNVCQYCSKIKILVMTQN